MPHNSKRTRPERRKARAGTTVRIDGLRVSREAWARVEALVAQFVRAGIPRAHRSGAMDLMLLQPDVTELLIAGGCRVYVCATCGGWTGDAAGAMAHQDAQPDHELQGFTVPPARRTWRLGELYGAASAWKPAESFHWSTRMNLSPSGGGVRASTRSTTERWKT